MKNKTHLCDYGCGKEAKFQLKNGKWCCCKSQNSCDNLKRVNQIKNKSLECREKTKNTCLNNLGVENPSFCKDFKSKSENTCLKKYGVKNPSMSPEIKIKKEKTSLEHYGVKNPSKSPEIVNKIKLKFNDPESIKKRLMTNPGPNTPERLLISLFEKLKLNFKYTGNGYTWIDGKNPDFTDFEKKKIVEHFGVYYHGNYFRNKYDNDFSSKREHEKSRINHFKKYGYDTLIIWENELKNIEKLESKIKRFVKRKLTI